MTSLSKARSRETNEIITPEEADALYLERKIRDKREFECIGYGCGAKITCANLDKPKKHRRRAPYFRTVESHANSCDIYELKNINTIDRGKLEVTHVEQAKSDELPDQLYLIRPKSHLTESRQSNEHGGIEIARHQPSETVIDETVISPINMYHLGSLVAKHELLRKKRLLEERQVVVDGRIFTYGALFKRVTKQEFKDYEHLRKSKYVYWGRVHSIKETREGSVKITFHGSARFMTAPSAVSVFIKRETLDEYRFRKPLKESILHSLGSEGVSMNLYIYGAPDQNANDRVYLNFNADNLDLVEIKEI